MQLLELTLGIKKNLMKNTNKIVWITGASSGIGAELAKIYSHRGIKLILSSRNVRALERVKSECYYPENIKILPIDLNDFYAAPALVKKAYNIFGRIDILINNAGVSQRSLIVDTQFDVFKKLDMLSKSEWEEIFDYATKKKITCFSTPFDEESVDLLYSLNVPAFKIASADITHIPLIKKTASKNLPIFLSTGMASDEEIDFAINFLKEK